MPATRHEFFSSEFLAQLERLTLLSRRVFRGHVKGERRSPRRGHSVEFADYRAYGVGDDLRYVDWNIYARTDRLHVKLFVDEEDLCLHLLVDGSASMGFGEPRKLDHAVRVAAALGFVGLVNLERVGVAVLRGRVAEGWPPARGRNQVPGLLGFLAGASARVRRGKEVVAESTIISLRRFKDDVKEVAAGLECGLKIENYSDLKPQDVVEVFEVIQLARKLEEIPK